MDNGYDDSFYIDDEAEGRNDYPCDVCGSWYDDDHDEMTHLEFSTFQAEVEYYLSSHFCPDCGEIFETDNFHRPDETVITRHAILWCGCKSDTQSYVLIFNEDYQPVQIYRGSSWMFGGRYQSSSVNLEHDDIPF